MQFTRNMEHLQEKYIMFVDYVLLGGLKAASLGVQRVELDAGPKTKWDESLSMSSLSSTVQSL